MWNKISEVIFTGTLPPRLLMTNYTTLYLSQREKVKLLLLIGRSLAIEASILRLNFFCILSHPHSWASAKKARRIRGWSNFSALAPNFRPSRMGQKIFAWQRLLRRLGGDTTHYTDNTLVSRDALHWMLTTYGEKQSGTINSSSHWCLVSMSAVNFDRSPKMTGRKAFHFMIQ